MLYERRQLVKFSLNVNDFEEILHICMEGCCMNDTIPLGILIVMDNLAKLPPVTLYHHHNYSQVFFTGNLIRMLNP